MLKKITKEEFKKLVLALENYAILNSYNLEDKYLSTKNLDTKDELPKELTDEINFFEKIQDKIYSQAKDFDMEKDFEINEDTNLLTIKQDTNLEKDFWEDVESIKKSLLKELVVREFVIRKSQKLRKENPGIEKDFEKFNQIIQEEAKKYSDEVSKNGLKNCYFKFD